MNLIFFYSHTNFKGTFGNFPRNGGIPWMRKSHNHSRFHRPPTYEGFHSSTFGWTANISKESIVPCLVRTMDSTRFWGEGCFGWKLQHPYIVTWGGGCCSFPWVKGNCEGQNPSKWACQTTISINFHWWMEKGNPFPPKKGLPNVP